MSLDNNNDVMDMTTAEEAALYQKLNDGYGETRDELNQLIGQIQMAEAFAKIADVVSLQKLQHIKENKLYKALKGKTIKIGLEKVPMVGTFDEFCKLIGSSRTAIDERLTNLNQFGLEAAETFERIGVSTKSLRLARKLPEDEQALIAEYTSKPEVTKDDVQQLISELDEKHKAELARKEAEIAAAKQATEKATLSLNSNRALLNKSEQEVEKLTIQIEERKLKVNDIDRHVNEITAVASKSTNKIVTAANEMSELALKLAELENPNADAILSAAMPQVYDFYLDAVQRAAACFMEFDHIFGAYANTSKATFNLIQQMAEQLEQAE